ncbi:hypothetical protein V6N13_139225 [Hibiscus sabdariffa]|uniref:DUF4408 domain-containing protein n=1 Tax=Hibiscus sabdariffa TaxID=183260 RepID=A0ABR2PL58_9ROSI
MASASTWMLSLKVLFISTGILGIALGFKISVPLVLEFCVSQAPLWWSTFRSWLRPPYLYVIINGIIITIVASSRFNFNQNKSEKDQTVQMQPRPKISVDRRPVEEYDTKSSWESDVVESSDFVYEQNHRGKEVETLIIEDESNVAVEAEEWIPPTRTNSSEIQLDALFPPEKPALSSRFGHQKPVKVNPEGGRALRVAKPKRHETLENTWKMIMEKKAMPLSRQLQKSDTWENHGRDMNVEASADSAMMKKSETFRDRTNYEVLPVQGKAKKEASLSQEELNRRVEAFIQKFNEEIRLQKQESLNQYMEMVNGGS